MGHAIEKGHCVAGWMALITWNLEITTKEEIEACEALEAEVLETCQEALEKLEPEDQNESGE